MWKYVGVNVDGITGVPTRDLTDEEFTEYSGKLNRQFPDQLGSLAKSGLYEYVEERPSRHTRNEPKEEVVPDVVAAPEGGEAN